MKTDKTEHATKQIQQMWPPSLYETLRKMAFDQNRSVTSIVIEAVEKYIKEG